MINSYTFLSSYINTCFIPFKTENLFIYTFKHPGAIPTMNIKSYINRNLGQLIFTHALRLCVHFAVFACNTYAGTLTGFA